MQNPLATPPEHHKLVTRAMSRWAPFSLMRRILRWDRSWLRTTDCQGSNADMTDCDEYPYASTHQGGQFGLGTVAIINRSDNRSAGGSLRQFYKRCGIAGNEMSGDQFFVLPVKGVPTFGICSP